MGKNIQELAEQLLLAVKMDEPYEALLTSLGQVPLQQLQDALVNDNQKKTFWINMYNALFLVLRKYQQVEKSAIYTSKLCEVAGQKLSLDDIEHGILRKYRYKFSLGYLPNPFASALIKKLAVDRVDYRLHFALNCGAVSCPPIAFYHEADIDKQLDMATRSFLEGDVQVDYEKRTIHISRLMLWYKGDFGGNSGIKRMLSEVLGLNPGEYKIIYKAYDWTEDLNNFIQL